MNAADAPASAALIATDLRNFMVTPCSARRTLGGAGTHHIRGAQAASSHLGEKLVVNATASPPCALFRRTATGGADAPLYRSYQHDCARGGRRHGMGRRPVRPARPGHHV